MAGAWALLIVLAAAVAVLAARPASAGGGAAAVAEICMKTPSPDLCTRTAGKHANKYKKRVKAARRLAKEEVKTAATPEARRALNLCKTYYLDAADNLGACKRAIGFRDAVTIRATMSMVAQDTQNCDEEFRKAVSKNPMEDHNRSLIEMSEICRTLSNMIPYEHVH
uniref:Pectinesterase inhibitor domain-containing protein n=1 Tax=Zea mays TaxID=4577 RepID=A0A804N1J7_MAIZE